MKKVYYILVGAIIIVLLLAVWFYLFISNSPQNDLGSFANFGEEGQEIDFIPEEQGGDESDYFINLNRDPLRQLTINPVAGYINLDASTTADPAIRYVEMGTGHVYEINLETGQETRLSNVTVAQAYSAKFSYLGDYVLIQTNDNDDLKKTALLSFSTTTKTYSETSTFYTHDFSFDKNNNILYTEVTDFGLRGVLVDANNTESSNTVFNIPFREAVILWGSEAAGPHYVYPKASYLLEGYLYEINNGSLKRLPLSGYGFTAAISGDYILYNTNEKLIPVSWFYNRTTGEKDRLKSPVLTEKCFGVNLENHQFVCGFDSTVGKIEVPDAWYQGKVSYADNIFLLSLSNISSNLVVDTLTESGGREIDIIKLVLSDSSRYFFINKNDNTLWLYEQ